MQSIGRGGGHSPSRVVGSVLRCLQWPFSWLFFCPLLLAWKHVQLSHHSVSAAVSLSPRLKTQKGPPGKVARPRLSGLMSKMFQSTGNLLQSGILSQFTSKNLTKRGRERERNEREEKWYLVVGSDRSTFLSIDMWCEWGVRLPGCWLGRQQWVHRLSSKIELSQTNWFNSRRMQSHSYTNRHSPLS